MKIASGRRCVGSRVAQPGAGNHGITGPPSAPVGGRRARLSPESDRSVDDGTGQ